jgi:hypothetical protein
MGFRITIAEESLEGIKGGLDLYENKRKVANSCVADLLVVDADLLLVGWWWMFTQLGRRLENRKPSH